MGIGKIVRGTGILALGLMKINGLTFFPLEFNKTEKWSIKNSVISLQPLMNSFSMIITTSFSKNNTKKNLFMVSSGQSSSSPSPICDSWTPSPKIEVLKPCSRSWIDHKLITILFSTCYQLLDFLWISSQEWISIDISQNYTIIVWVSLRTVWR